MPNMKTTCVGAALCLVLVSQARPAHGDFYPFTKGDGENTESQPEQSYSERQLYEAALDRLSREIAAVQHITETEAVKEIEAALAKGPRRGPKPAEELVEEEAA